MYLLPNRDSYACFLIIALLLSVFCASSLFAQSNAGSNLAAQAPISPTQGGSDAARQPQPEPQSKDAPPDLKIGGGDLLQVAVYGVPDFDKEVRVSTTGEISLPMAGAINVSGLTVRDAANLIARRLVQGGFFTDPQVAVFAKEYATQGISVLGEVQKPGIYPLLGARTLFEAISAAGGTTAKAGKSASITHRDRPSQPETVNLSYGPNDSPKSNVAVLPGDTIVVLKAGVVYVVGDVRQPSGIVMESPQITVLQAIAMAQGSNPTASLNRAKLIRKTSEGPQEIPIPLDKILASKAPDPTLQPDDIVFVPASAGKAVARRSMEAILQMATGVIVYRRY